MCRACRDGISPVGRQRPPDHVDRCTAAFPYEGAARKAVLDLKLGGRRPAARRLGLEMTHRLWASGTQADVITWVPARRRDNVDRGFDHARLLAEEMSRHTGLPALPLLRRCRLAEHQTELRREERAANLRGVFEALPEVPARLLLVDDLVTTGATASACAAALRWSGATRVEVAVACRAT